MVYSRFPMKDPRTIARDIPGIFDVIFPQLTSGVVAYFNKKAVSYSDINSLPDEQVQLSTLQQAMLFEIAYARAEQILNDYDKPSWDSCLSVAIKRQRNHFDAQLPDKLSRIDIETAEWVAKNLVSMLNQIQIETPEYKLIHSPEIVGFQWISSGVGDFSLGSNLIEVKCINKRFGAADYRQVLMYWLLSYASAIEHGANEWKKITLLNPRKNYAVKVSFDEIIEVTAAGKSKIEIVELFSSMVGDFAIRTLPEFKY